MKKLESKGFTHHLTMFAILAVVLGAMGFAGWRVYQNRNIIDAKAGSYTPIQNTSFVTASACKSGPYRDDAGRTFYRTVIILATTKHPGGYYSGTAARIGGSLKVSNNRSSAFSFNDVSSTAQVEAGAYHFGGNAVTHGIYLSKIAATC